MLHDQLKTELLAAIDDYINAIGRDHLTTEAAKLTMELIVLINRSRSGSALKLLMKNRLAKVPYQFWGFLPGVRDLRRSLELILRKQDYKIAAVLTEETQNLMKQNEVLIEKFDEECQENKQLRDKVTILEQALKESSPNNIQAWQEYEERCRELEQKQTALAEINQSKAREILSLQQQVEALQETIDTQATQLKNAEAREENLGHLHEEVIDENSRLHVRIEELERELKKVTSNNSKLDNHASHKESKQAGSSSTNYALFYTHKMK